MNTSRSHIQSDPSEYSQRLVFPLRKASTRFQSNRSPTLRRRTAAQLMASDWCFQALVFCRLPEKTRLWLFTRSCFFCFPFCFPSVDSLQTKPFQGLKFATSQPIKEKESLISVYLNYGKALSLASCVPGRGGRGVRRDKEENEKQKPNFAVDSNNLGFEQLVGVFLAPGGRTAWEDRKKPLPAAPSSSERASPELRQEARFS